MSPGRQVDAPVSHVFLPGSSHPIEPRPGSRPQSLACASRRDPRGAGVRRRDEGSRAGPARETCSNPAVAIAEDARASGHWEAVATGESRPGSVP